MGQPKNSEAAKIRHREFMREYQRKKRAAAAQRKAEIVAEYHAGIADNSAPAIPDSAPAIPAEIPESPDSTVVNESPDSPVVNESENICALFKPAPGVIPLEYDQEWQKGLADFVRNRR